MSTRQTLIKILLFIFFFYLLPVKESNAQTIDQQIYKVETGLLSRNIFEGEPGYSIKKG